MTTKLYLCALLAIVWIVALPASGYQSGCNEHYVTLSFYDYNNVPLGNTEISIVHDATYDETNVNMIVVFGIFKIAIPNITRMVVSTDSNGTTIIPMIRSEEYDITCGDSIVHIIPTENSYAIKCA